MYVKEYKKLSKEYHEYKRMLTETSENRKMYNLCKGIDNLEH